MNHQEALKRGAEILRIAGVRDAPPVKSFLDYGALVAYAARNLPERDKQAIPQFREWAEKWREMYDRFDQLVAADPLMLYQPANKAVEEFHRSSAYVRYMRMPNRTGKTQGGVAEHYFVTTGQHPYRWFPKPPLSTFIIAGLPFSTYASGVFEKKFISGEDANPLSPAFPVGGKWFNHYDERKYLITLACPECAEAGKAGSCSHSKSTIKLFSNEQGWEVLQGMAFALGHFDEHVSEDFYIEGRQRTKTVPGGCLILTATPLQGEEAWEQTKIARLVDDPVANRVDLDDPKSPPFASLHQISRYDAGLEPAWKIKSEEAQLDEFEAQARIYGKPAPLAKNPVFDRKILQEMRKACKTPSLVRLDLPSDVTLMNVQPDVGLTAVPDHGSLLRVWKAPEPGETYICSVDTAAGLSQDKDRGDNSCASILRVFQKPMGVGLELVAQFHGKITLLDYADEVMKLAIWYNSALCVVELTGGYGVAVVMRLKEHAYWNMYRPVVDKAAVGMNLDPKLGIDTSPQSKPFMVSSLQYLIKNHSLLVYDTATIGELVAFTQETEGAGGSKLMQPRYRGAGGAHDDRVMSLAIASAVAISDQRILYAVQFAANQKPASTVSPVMKEVFAELEAERLGDDLL
jgi:phage terminase large subunit-like protein